MKIALLHKISRPSLVLVICCVCITEYANAAEWNFQSRVSAAGIYTDNVMLATSGNEENDLITEIIPGISARAVAPDFNFYLDYQLQGVFYSDNSQYNDGYHQFVASMNTGVLSSLLFLDANAIYTQRTIDPQQPVADNNIGISSNTTDVATYRLSPYLRKKFGENVLGIARFSYTNTNNLSAELPDSTERGVNIDLSSQNNSRNLSWHLGYTGRNVESGDDVNWKYQSASLEMAYPVSGRFAVSAAGGYESSEYENSTLEESGSFWNVGTIWNPTRLTQLTAKYGNRVFGNTGSFSFSHRSSKWTTILSYDEEFANSNSLLSPEYDPLQTGSSIFNPTDPAITTGTYLEKRYNVEIRRTTAKTVFRLGGTHRERSYRVTGEIERSQETFLSWQWKFNTRLDVLLGRDVQSNEYVSSARQDDLYKNYLTVNRRLSVKSNLSFEYSNYNRESNIAGTEYTQNIYAIRYNTQL